MRSVPGAAATLRILLDTCAVEIFADDGAVTFSALVASTEACMTLTLRSAGGEAHVSGEVYSLDPITPAQERENT
jgi:sucrose-6-phosphate hydrolase SacC (GH32 family)